MPWRRKKQPEPVPPPAVPTSVSISGIHHSQVSTGADNHQYYHSPATTPAPDAAALASAIAALRDAVIAQAGPRKAEALERVETFDRAAHAVPPDGKAMIAARDWLHSALPNLATALGTVLVNPSVDTAITAAMRAVRDTAVDAAKQKPARESAEN
jgi:hypothetical protein